MSFLVICIALAVAFCKGQDCIGGALFNDYNINSNNIDEYQPISATWYINLNEPCTCSGKVLKYKVDYYTLDEERYVAYAAMWRQREEPELGFYDVVDSSPTKFDIDNDKRKKRDSPDDSEDIDVSDDDLYIRKGSFVGIYFQNWSGTNRLQLPVIGQASSGDYSVCKIPGAKTTQILNCTSSDFIESNLVIFAEAQIEKLECSNAPNNYDNTKNPVYIDGDKEYGARVHYECITGYTDTNGHDYLACDENENWAGTIPICVVVTCDNITSLPNGNVNNANGFTYQSTVTFSCDTGYNLNGTSSIICQDNRNWSDNIPTCDIVKCQDRDMPENGYKSDHNLTYGSSIEFGCVNGYDLSGDSFITCEADGTWNGTIPSCIPINCPVVNNPENGSKNSSLITFGSIVSFNCDEGYYLNGTDAIICEDDMIWSDPIPRCFLINCGNPGVAPSNGSTEGSDYFYGSVVTFNCDNGYELNGSISIICGNDSNWNASVPVCNLVSCDSPVIDNYTNVSSNTYTYQSNIEFECITGYELNGNTSATCLANGEWNVTSPSCEPVTCDLPASPVNGTIANEPSLTFDTFIEYECDIGYTITGWPVIVCNASKEWNGTVPTCEIVVCESPNTPVNGKNLTNEEEFVYQSIVEYECDDGYELEGNSSIVCTAQGNWSSLIPVCNPVDCGEPDQIEYGEQIGSNYTYGYSIEYDCEIGYILTGSNVLQCTENGTWNASAPVCELVQCDNISVLNGIKIGNNHTYGSVLNFSCTEGYNLNGTATITCQSNGEWSSSIPTCIPVYCGDPGTPLMGSQNINATYTFGSLVTFTCNEGYELLLNESNTTMCQADGNWTNADLPNCSIVNCEPPEFPANGQIEGNVFTYGSTISFTCNTGFVLVGEPMIVCLEDESWSSETSPVCHQTCSKLQVRFH